ncbi:MAG TPA: hypothetical protein VMT57_04350 [Candidatus Thermoplasmatota archaeon]|nr:hypothetical protein [Candidatus Thermoplasmatota archaeon]
MASLLRRGFLWTAVLLLLVSSGGSIVQAGQYRPAAIDSFPYKQLLAIPIDTSQEGAKDQPVDLRVTFENPCWGTNETLNAVRVGFDDGSGLQEIDSQVYDLEHSDDTHLKACSLVFLIPEEANGKEKYYVVYDSKETDPANYQTHVTLEDTHYFYEPIPGQTIDFDYYGIRQDGYVVYAVVQKGQLLGNPVALSAIKFKPNSTTVETYNLDQLGDFDFRYGVPGEPDYVGSSHATDVIKIVLAQGNLMVRVRLQCTSPRGDIASDNIYTYYYSPTNAKRIMIDAHHEILKPITIDDPSEEDGAYTGIVSIKARSASIQKMNVGDILPSMYVYANDSTIQQYSVPTSPQSTVKEVVLSPEDDVGLGPHAWVCLNDPTSGKVHGLIFSATTGITNGSEDGLQVRAYSKQNVKLPGLSADTGTLELTRTTYQSGDHLTTVAQGNTYHYKVEFITAETGGDTRIDEESTMYQHLVKDAPVFRGNETTIPEENVQRYNLTVYAHLARSVPLGSLLSAALGKNISYIYAELYQEQTFRSSGTVGRLALGAISLNMSGKTFTQKLQSILGIFDFKNTSLFKKIRFPLLDPGTYVVKIYRENPRFAKERQFIGVVVVNLSKDTKVHVLCRPQGSIKISLLDQEKNGVQNARCELKLADITIAETMTDANGTATLAAPCYPLKPYHLVIQYQGFIVGEQKVTLNLVRRFIAMKTTFSVDRYALALTVTDTWGFPPAVEINPTLVSTAMATSTPIRAKVTKAGQYQFSDLPPASYRLSLVYKAFKVEDNITLDKDTALETKFPAEFPVTFTLYDSYAGSLSQGEISFRRNDKTESTTIKENGTAVMSLPPGDYEILVQADDDTIAQQEVHVRGEKNLDIVTSQGSLMHLAVTYLGLALVIGAILFVIWKRKLGVGLKLIATGVLVITLVSPWWVLHGETGTVSTTTNTLVIPPQIVTLTTSSNATGGEISAVPQQVTMVLGLLSLLVGVAFLVILGSLALKSKFRKITILVWLLSIIVLLLTSILFYFAFSQLTQVGVGSFMGSGTLDITIPGVEAPVQVPCSWGPGLGFYLLIVALALVILTFFSKGIEGRLSRK